MLTQCVWEGLQITHQQNLFLHLLASEGLTALHVWKKQPVQKAWCKALLAKYVIIVMLWEGFGIASTGKQKLAILFFFCSKYLDFGGFF